MYFARRYPRFLLTLSAVAVLQACTSAELGNAVLAGATPMLQAATVTPEQLKSSSLRMVAQMDEKMGRAPASNAYSRRLNRITAGLEHYRGLNLNFGVYIDDSVNAFAAPDGSIRVFSGLMDQMEDDEVLAVIGHEIGHVVNEHALSQMRKALMTRGVREALASTQKGALAAGTLGVLSETAINAQFSQKDELQSDDFALGFLRDAGKDPRAMLRAIRKLESLGGGGGFLSSHPSNPKRVANMQRQL